MRSIKIVLSNERIVPNSGLYLVNKILSKSNLVKMINKIKSGKRSQKYISNGDIIKICIGLLSLGKVENIVRNIFKVTDSVDNVNLATKGGKGPGIGGTFKMFFSK